MSAGSVYSVRYLKQIGGYLLGVYSIIYMRQIDGCPDVAGSTLSFT